ncbi:tetratricopeptide repeat protein [Photorhabdus aegyptia]|uniref:PIN domain-containing protein n=1 Tax=Photorhabdus aegyptia TaxID=2805098 RepID=A0A022PMU8_9GAMM|nr:hypothetical protein [Photorhabdus aegyptia]EYU15890.1 hypothetical protein BA1DRAFT_01515 [Photorhabdus aegyptia]
MEKQIHTGSGDNVGNNKIVNIINSIEPKDIRRFIDDLMHDISYRKISEAEKKINAITNIDALDNNVKSILNALKVKISLVQGKTDLPKQEIQVLLRNPALSNEVRDAVLSILIHLESHVQLESARERYLFTELKGPYSNEVFFEHLATIDEINSSFNSSEKLNFLEQEIIGLIRGSLRNRDFKTAYGISDYLNKNYPSENSMFFMLHCETLLFLKEIKNRHILSFDKKQKNHIDSLVSTLLKNFASDIPRYTSPLINQLYITNFTDRKLLELAQKYLNKISEVSPECAEVISKITNRTALQNTKFSLPKEIKSIETFSELGELLKTDSFDKTLLADWRGDGGKISTNDSYINALLELQVSVWLCIPQDKKAIFDLGKQAEEFLNFDAIRYKEMTPSNLIFLCEKFMDLGLPLIAVKYLEPILPDEPWLSPLLESLLQALYLSDQNDLFFKKLALFSDDEKSELVWLLEAQAYERLQKNDDAIRAIQAAIKLENKNAYSWDLLLHLYQNKNISKVDLTNMVMGIPEEIFSTYDESKIPLLNSIAKFVDHNISERVLVDWFVVNPNKLAKYLIDIHHNSLMFRSEVNKFVYLPRFCIKGVEFDDGFRKHQRILVKDIVTEHPLFLNVNSPLGKVIEKLAIGETIDDPMLGELTLTDETPAFVAAYQAAIKIRDQNNDGSDAFKLFELPPNDDDFLPYFEKILRRYSNKPSQHNPILLNPNIPLCMRGNLTHSGDYFRAAYFHLTSKETTQYINLYDQGIIDPHKVIVDIYTSIYLSLMSFISIIVKKSITIVISNYTKITLENWITDITREDYLSFDITTLGIQRITAEDIRKNLYDFIQELQLLLSIAEDENLNVVDTPENLVKIKDLIDPTIFSTIQLSYANEIPWLSIDHLLCILAQNSDFPVANMDNFLREIINSSTYKERKKSIFISLICGLSVPVFYKDIAILSCSHEKNDIYLVAKFIEKHKFPNNTSSEVLNFLSEIMRNVIIKAYLDRDILIGGRASNPIYDGYEEYVFNVCCHTATLCLEGKTAEARVALLISETLKPFYHIVSFRKLVFNLATSFSTGHFLDIEAINNELDKIITIRNDTTDSPSDTRI